MERLKKVEGKGEINTNKSDTKGAQKRETNRQGKKCKQDAALYSNKREGGFCHLLDRRVLCLLPVHATPFPAAHFAPDVGCPYNCTDQFRKPND